ncbi:MAG TPA: hypothetical protein VGF25_05410 [Thermoleophilaceae bacterium]
MVVVVLLALATAATVGPVLAHRLPCEITSLLRRAFGGEAAACAGSAQFAGDTRLVPAQADGGQAKPPPAPSGPLSFDVQELDLFPGGTRSVRVFRRETAITDERGRVLARIPPGTRFALDWSPMATIRPLVPLRIPTRDGTRFLELSELRQAVPFNRWWPGRADVVDLTTTRPLAAEDRDYLQSIAADLFVGLLMESNGEARPPGDDPLVNRLRLIVAELDRFWRGRLPQLAGQMDRVRIRGHPRQRSGSRYPRVSPDGTVEPGFVVIGVHDGGARPGEIAYALGHEWGHQILYSVTGQREAARGPVAEQQADCLAGAAMSRLIARGLVDPDVAVAEAESSIVAGFDSLSHGRVRDRLTSFRQGLTGGRADPLARCHVPG